AFFDAVDVSNIGVIERSQHLSLTLKAKHAAGIADERFGQHLQRHVTLQLRVARAVHHTHTTGADGRGDLIGAEFCADGDGQSTTSLCLALSLVDSNTSVNLRSMEGEVSDDASRHMPGKPRNRTLACQTLAKLRQALAALR